MTGLIDFSIFASENGAAAPPINFQEGMPANAVNNSNREMMAALARWRDDNAGGLVATRAAGDVYRVTTSQGFSPAAIAKAHTLAFSVDALNQAPATLSVDGAGAKPLLRHLGRQLGPGDLAPNVAYTVRYLPGPNAYFIVSPTIVRPGLILPVAAAGSDPGWVPADGRALSRTAYAALFAEIGTVYGAGDGTTTFNVPDINRRTMFGPGLSGVGGIGGTLGSAGGLEVVALTVAHLAPHDHSGTATGAGAHTHTTDTQGQHNHSGSTGNGGSHNHTGTTGGAGRHSHGGTTAPAGAHVHQQNYERVSIYGGGGSLSAVSQLFPPGNNSGATSESSGTHQHTITTDEVGDHTHNFTTSGVADHAHSIGLDGNHAHVVSDVPNHTHAISIGPAGQGDAHTNMPPGIVVAFVIKT